MKKLSKRQAKIMLGIKTDIELARFFGITRQAVGLWSRYLPASRVWELRAKLHERNMEAS